MFCVDCGAAVLGGAKFCGKCGAKVEVADDKGATSNLVPSPHPIPSAPQERVQSMEGVQRIEAQGQSTFVGVMRAVAVVVGIILGLNLVAGWIWFLISPDIGGFFFFAVFSVVVIWLVRWGLLGPSKDALLVHVTGVTAPLVRVNATCPHCSSSLMSDDLACVKCGANFTAAEGWRPIPMP